MFKFAKHEVNFLKNNIERFSIPKVDTINVKRKKNKRKKECSQDLQIEKECKHYQVDMKKKNKNIDVLYLSH